jgi:hypothetical protein
MIETTSTRFAHIATNVERLDDLRYASLRSGSPRLTRAGPLGERLLAGSGEARWPRTFDRARSRAGAGGLRLP